MKWSLVALLGALALPAHAQDIVGGQPTQNFKAVGRGVQVSPDWVMTARHAVIGVGGTYENGYGMRTVAEVFVPDTADFPANDFALLRLEPLASPVPGAVYPRIASEPFVQGAFRPQPVTIASIANHSPRGVGLTWVTESLVQYDDDGPTGPLPLVDVNWLVSWDPNVRLENGDSGGGLFLDHVRDSVGVLLGLSSALLQDDAGRIGSAFVQPAAYRSWIDGIMRADLHDEQRLAWAGSAGAVPEPAAWMLLLAGGGLLQAARRRRP